MCKLIILYLYEVYLRTQTKLDMAGSNCDITGYDKKQL